MKKVYILLLFSITIFCISCSNHYYSPALYKNDIAYQFKPMSSDKEKSADYVSGALNLGTGHNLNDNVILGMLRYNHANTYDNFNLSYGAYGFAGSYQNYSIQTTDAGYFTTKSVSGIGGRISANTYVKEGNADVRLFGIDISYSQEFGEYSDFRKQAQNIPTFYSDGNSSVLTAGITNETIWKSDRSDAFQYGYRLFFGSVFGNHSFANNGNPNNVNSPYVVYGSICLSGAAVFQVQKVQAVIEMTNFASIQLSFGYRF